MMRSSLKPSTSLRTHIHSYDHWAAWAPIAGGNGIASASELVPLAASIGDPAVPLRRAQRPDKCAKRRRICSGGVGAIEPRGGNRTASASELVPFAAPVSDAAAPLHRAQRLGKCAKWRRIYSPAHLSRPPSQMSQHRLRTAAEASTPQYAAILILGLPAA